MKSVPLLLTLLRALLAPVMVFLAIYKPLPVAFGMCLVVAFVSDVFDGASPIHVRQERDDEVR